MKRSLVTAIHAMDAGTLEVVIEILIENFVGKTKCTTFDSHCPQCQTQELIAALRGKLAKKKRKAA